MRDNVQAFYEAVVKDAALREKLVSLEKEVAGKELTTAEREAFIREQVLPVAKAAGFDLTPEELKAYQPKEELSDRELSEVSGGGACFCFIAGGAKGAGCVLIGGGKNFACFLGGSDFGGPSQPNVPFV